TEGLFASGKLQATLPTLHPDNKCLPLITGAGNQPHIRTLRIPHLYTTHHTTKLNTVDVSTVPRLPPLRLLIRHGHSASPFDRRMSAMSLVESAGLIAASRSVSTASRYR